MAALLAPAGVPVRTAALYETTAAEPAQALAVLEAISTVLVHSPKAARRLAALLDPAALARLDFACISEAAARPLVETGARNVRFAPSPTRSRLARARPIAPPLKPPPPMPTNDRPPEPPPESPPEPPPEPPEDERPFRVLDVRFGSRSPFWCSA